MLHRSSTKMKLASAFSLATICFASVASTRATGSTGSVDTSSQTGTAISSSLGRGVPRSTLRTRVADGAFRIDGVQYRASVVIQLVDSPLADASDLAPNFGARRYVVRVQRADGRPISRGFAILPAFGVTRAGEPRRAFELIPQPFTPGAFSQAWVTTAEFFPITLAEYRPVCDLLFRTRRSSARAIVNNVFMEVPNPVP